MPNINHNLSDISVSSLKGVGAKIVEKLAQLSIHNIEDLLFHLPSRYEDRSRIHPIGSLRQGQTAQVFGMIETADIVFGKRRSLVCKISDGSGMLDIRLFYFSMAQKKQFVRGEYLQCYGQVSHSGRLYGMIHPQLKFLRNQPTPQLQAGLHAVYPTTAGLQQRSLLQLIEQALDKLKDAKVNDLIPRQWLTKLNFPALSDALHMLHRPDLQMSLEVLQTGDHILIKRLAFEELVAQHLAMQQIKAKNQQQSAISINTDSSQSQQFIEQLPFQLTNAQQRVIQQIKQDLANTFPMMRLVQGDVGSGKTLVAAVNMLEVAHAGYQSVLMAPTEILAEQHFKTFSQWFSTQNLTAVLLVSKMSAAEKKQALAAIESGEAKMVIGTHALFQTQVTFNNLALVVIDEQHRFGVEQRKQLLQKANAKKTANVLPHQLIMTATPIPRTLAQTAYAHLQVSVIDELPPGRKPVSTMVISDEKRDQVIERLRQACGEDKRQAYWVCTLIDESEELQCQAAEVTHQQLKDNLTELNIGLVHGRMKSQQKQSVMLDFKQGKLDVLVATTVIEVGVDVANASLMIIENPERLGLSQLHQLRGRVGRGSQQSHCLLMYHSPLSNNAKQRLKVMRESSDGFVIAEKDLQLRGPGEMLGTKQTGSLEFRFADLLRDNSLLPQVQACASEIQKNMPQNIQPLIKRWVKQGGELSRI